MGIGGQLHLSPLHRFEASLKFIPICLSPSYLSAYVLCICLCVWCSLCLLVWLVHWSLWVPFISTHVTCILSHLSCVCSWFCSCPLSTVISCPFLIYSSLPVSADCDWVPSVCQLCVCPLYSKPPLCGLHLPTARAEGSAELSPERLLRFREVAKEEDGKDDQGGWWWWQQQRGTVKAWAWLLH